MRIVHVVTLVSPDGAYGGPVRVAINQLKALQRRGHEVLLVGGYRGFTHPPSEIDGVPVQLFPVNRVLPRAGFAGLASPRLMRTQRDILSSFDIVHVHLARDFVTLPAARSALRNEIPVVAQTHGMIDPSRRWLSRPLDLLWTRPTLRRARSVLFLTDTEKIAIRAVGGDAINSVHLPNGVPRSNASQPVLAAKGSLNVLFMGRLHPTKRPLLFAEAALQLRRSFPDVTFSLVGPDEGEGEALLKFIERHDLHGYVDWEGPLDPALTFGRMQGASVFVNPRIAEPFAMATLEAASAGLAIVATASSGISDEIQQFDAGEVIGDSLSDLVSALALLLQDPERLRLKGENARSMIATSFDIERIAERLEGIYSQAVSL